MADTEIIIAVTGCSVTIKADAPLDEVTKQALDLYQSIVPEDIGRTGAAVGFTGERRWSTHIARPIDMAK
jgi:hypothetical protein